MHDGGRLLGRLSGICTAIKGDKLEGLEPLCSLDMGSIRHGGYITTLHDHGPDAQPAPLLTVIKVITASMATAVNTMPSTTGRLENDEAGADGRRGWRVGLAGGGGHAGRMPHWRRRARM